MATARIKGVQCDVRVTRDLTDNWAVEVSPVLDKPRKAEPFKPPPAPLILKVRSDTPEAAVKAALEALKAKNRIDDFIL